MSRAVLVFLLLNCLVNCYYSIPVNNVLYENIIPKATDNKQTLRPVIIVPGLEGNRLEAKLDKKRVVNVFCSKKSDYFNIWFNAGEFFPVAMSCFTDNMKLRFNAATGKAESAEGVEVRAPGFGDTYSVETLSSSLDMAAFSYFENLVNAFVEKGYERSVNIRAAPYDFRKSPTDQEEYFDKLAALVEETYSINNNTSSALLCHSMGCMFSLYFLNQRTDEWKAQYVKSLISVGAPWAGSVKAVKAISSGDNLGVVIYSDNNFREMERTFSSLTFLLPSASAWPENEPLVINQETPYTVANYEQLFRDLYSNGNVSYQMWLKSRHLISDLKHPGVDVHCIHGKGETTANRLVYGSDYDFPDNPGVQYGDGDGTVNSISLEACLKWKDHPVHDFTYNVIPGEHVAMIKDGNVINYISQAINEVE